MHFSGKTEQVFFSGNDYFSALLKDIALAKKTIELETYIFYHDKLGKKVLAALEKAAENGVKISILVDGAGTPQWGGSFIKNLEKLGAETRIFHPIPWRLWHWSRSHVRANSILKAIYLFLKINSRNHRKVCLIDNKIAYIGSFNICQSHLEKSFEGDDWRDTGIRLANTDLSDLILAFAAAWNHLPIQERIKHFFHHVHKNPVIRLNNTRHRRRILYKDLLHKINNTRNRVWITNAYFVPDNFLLRKLREAAHAKIDVRILLPRKSDIAFMPWASKAFYEKLLKSGVRIFEYQPSVLHAKTLILDDWMLIGSSNLNHRSLLHDLEVDINIQQTESQEALAKQFYIDLENSKEICLENWQKPPLHQRIIGKLLLYLKYLI